MNHFAFSSALNRSNSIRWCIIIVFLKQNLSTKQQPYLTKTYLLCCINYVHHLLHILLAYLLGSHSIPLTKKLLFLEALYLCGAHQIIQSFNRPNTIQGYYNGLKRVITQSTDRVTGMLPVMASWLGGKI